MKISIYNSYHTDTCRRINPTAAPHSSRPEQPKKAERDTALFGFKRLESDEDFSRALAGPIAAQVLSSEVPQSRIEELSVQIEQGLYQPDADKIAGRLLGLE